MTFSFPSVNLDEENKVDRADDKIFWKTHYSFIEKSSRSFNEEKLIHLVFGWVGKTWQYKVRISKGRRKWERINNWMGVLIVQVLGFWGFGVLGFKRLEMLKWQTHSHSLSLRIRKKIMNRSRSRLKTTTKALCNY